MIALDERLGFSDLVVSSELRTKQQILWIGCQPRMRHNTKPFFFRNRGSLLIRAYAQSVMEFIKPGCPQFLQLRPQVGKLLL